MSKRSFEQWVRGIFDHAVEDPAWYWDIDSDDFCEADTTNAEYLTRLFLECDEVLVGYNDAQAGQGLYMIASNSCSNHAHSITGGDAPWPVRQRAIRSIYSLYEKCFSKRCENGLGHLSEPTNKLNDPCYMWWDIFPAWCDPTDQAKDQEASEYIQVMAKCLNLTHDACIEGALHGLGHWSLNYPEKTTPIIDRFLKQQPNLRPELLSYARAARAGMIQ